MDKNFKKAVEYITKIIDFWFPYKIQYTQIPGASVGIVYNGKLIYQKGFGFADVKLKIPATPETCYFIASISKTFTAVAIMQLVEKRKINLEDRIEKYLPWFKNPYKITIQEILSHSSGIWRDGNTPHWETDQFPDIKILKRLISKETFVFKNSTRFKYSNFGFALLGEVIKEVSGLSYKEYIKKHIIEKLRMKKTFPDFQKEAKKYLAKGYGRIIPNKKEEIFKPCKTKAYAPATGFISNVPDLSKYLTALSLKQKNNLLLSKKSKKKMMKEYWKTGERNEWYGLGFDICKIEKRKIIGHSGSFPGFSSRISLDLENDLGIITLFNRDNIFSFWFHQGIFESLYKFLDEKNKYLSGEKIKNQEKYEGIYRSRWGDMIILGIDTKLIAFDVRVISPLKEGALLLPKRKDEFLIETKNNFDSVGEAVKFIFDSRKKKAKKLIWGSTPFLRIDQ
jgi:CubicO group peptidase (beta-lactamase class C family)